MGLYLNPPENAIVMSVDEKPGIQAKTQKTGFVRKHDGTGVNSTSRRNGTTNLFAALAMATGSGRSTRNGRMSSHAWMTGWNLRRKGKELHGILDNYCTHKHCTQWLEKHSTVHFHLSKLAEQGKDMVQQNE